MKQTIIFKKILNIFILFSLLIQISACGWILHPERSGQRGGRIDLGIAVLDGVGLLLFLVPGIVAFAVDFSTGCIYLPPGSFSGAPGADKIDADEIKVVHVDPAKLNETTIKTIIIREAGLSAVIDLNQAEFCALNRSGDISGKLAEMKKFGYLSRASIMNR